MIFVPSVWMTMADLFEIIGVRAADGGARLVLTVESTFAGEASRETLTVLTARLARVPQKGAIDGETLVFLRREHALCAALSTGMRSLSASGGSRLQLQQKLCHKGVAREVADDAVEELSQKGYLDEKKSALSTAESGLRKLWGDRRILADLRTKGYGKEALLAVQERLRGEDAVARLARLWGKRRFDAENPDKLIAALMRYGYTRAEIRAALKSIMK